MVHQLLAVFLGLIVTFVSCHEKFFRRDYTFFDEYNAFYKLHWADGASSWDDAFLTCDDEGSKLFYPEAIDEWQVAANLSDSLTDVEGIFVGVRDEFGRGDFLSVDGRFIPEFSKNHIKDQDASESKCVVMSVHTGAYSIGSCKHRRAFICKKADDELCPTVDSSYIYSKETKKCFKVNDRQKTWEDALHTCFMEGGILTTTLQKSKDTMMPHLTRNELYFIGFQRIIPHGDFYSVQGVRTDIPTEDRNDCGAIILEYRQDEYGNKPNNFRMTSYDCNKTLPFICEMNTSN